MVKSSATTVNQYLEELPADRRKAIAEVRSMILKNLPKGYVETIRWGMISYEIPLEVHPTTYNKQPLSYAALGSQKNYMVLHMMMTIFGGRDKQFREAYKKTGKTLDMGMGCLRFKRIEDLPMDLIAKEVASMSPSEYIKAFEANRKTAFANRAK